MLDFISSCFRRVYATHSVSFHFVSLYSDWMAADGWIYRWNEVNWLCRWLFRLEADQQVNERMKQPVDYENKKKR